MRWRYSACRKMSWVCSLKLERRESIAILWESSTLKAGINLTIFVNGWECPVISALKNSLLTATTRKRFPKQYLRLSQVQKKEKQEQLEVPNLTVPSSSHHEEIRRLPGTRRANSGRCKVCRHAALLCLLDKYTRF
jgi:hypothetical protein